MADIAKRIGVSTSTVSRALKGNPRISKSTCQRVQKVAREMGYRPSPLVRALMESRRSSSKQEICTIAFITDDRSPKDWSHKPTCTQTFDGVTKRSKELGYRIDVLSTQELNLESNQLEKVLLARGITGAIFGFSKASTPNFSFDASDFAVVGLASYFRTFSLDRVKDHGFFNVQLGLRKLRELGYQKIGLVVPSYNNELVGCSWTAAALEDSRTLPKRSQCPPLVTTEVDCPSEEFFRWFDRHEPDAFLVYRVPVCAFLKSRGLTIPENIGVAWLFRSDEDVKRGAGINANLEESGVALVDTLSAKLHANDFGVLEHNRHLLIDGFWVNGSSVRNQRP